MPKRILKSEISAGIFLLRFTTQYELASTFLRVQEHYESKRFCGRIFSLEEYMDWYVETFDAFTYYEDWAGFNVPSAAFKPFYEGKFDPLTRKEKRLLRMFSRQRKPFYVIGVTMDAPRGDFIHELAHALFSVDAEYRKAVQNELRSYDISAMKRSLAGMGYATKVLQDEVQAYLVAPDGQLGRSQRRLAPLGRKLRRIFKRHSAGLSLP